MKRLILFACFFNIYYLFCDSETSDDNVSKKGCSSKKNDPVIIKNIYDKTERFDYEIIDYCNRLCGKRVVGNEDYIVSLYDKKGVDTEFFFTERDVENIQFYLQEYVTLFSGNGYKDIYNKVKDIFNQNIKFYDSTRKEVEKDVIQTNLTKIDEFNNPVDVQKKLEEENKKAEDINAETSSSSGPPRPPSEVPQAVPKQVGEVDNKAPQVMSMADQIANFKFKKAVKEGGPSKAEPPKVKPTTPGDLLTMQIRLRRENLARAKAMKDDSDSSSSSDTFD